MTTSQNGAQDPSQCQTSRSTLSAGSMTTSQNGVRDPSQCQTPRSTLSAGSMTTSQNGVQDPSQCQNGVPLCGSIASSTHQQKCNKQGHCTLHNACDSKNSVATRYLMNNECIKLCFGICVFCCGYMDSQHKINTTMISLLLRTSY